MPKLQTQAIVKVGDGRGFLVHARRERIVILTAAHCLTHLPPPHPASYTEERTYLHLVGELDAPGTIAVECAFVDPIHDVAVLTGPDDQAFNEEAEAYDAFVAARDALRIGRLPVAATGCVCSLAGAWEACDLEPWPHGRFVDVKRVRIQSGMSGSPILDADGRAVGLVSVDDMNPILANVLPVWALVDLQLMKPNATNNPELMVFTVYSFLVVDLVTRQSVGIGMVCPEAQYAALLYEGVDRPDRRSVPAGAWSQLRKELRGLKYGAVDADSVLSRTLLDQQQSPSRSLEALSRMRIEGKAAASAQQLDEMMQRFLLAERLTLQLERQKKS
jgi:hypothetical protein